MSAACVSLTADTIKKVGRAYLPLSSLPSSPNCTRSSLYIRNTLVSEWVRRYLQDGEEALQPRNGNPYAALHRSKNLSEVERLRLLVAKQEVEIARLKKGYWVEGVGADREYVTGSGKTTKFSKNSK